MLSINDNDNMVELPPFQIKDILLGKIPIIVKSKYCVTNFVLSDECPYDPGGYVIINGNEKVIISQEKIAPNIIQVYKNQKLNKKYKLVAEVRSAPEKKFVVPKLTSVKIIESLYNKFKLKTVNTDMTLQKLTNRSVNMFLENEEFRESVETYENLKISGSNF